VHLGARECAQRLAAHVALGADREAHRSHGGIVGGVEGHHEIVAPDRPSDVGHRDARFLYRGFELLGPPGGVLDGANALVGELRQHDVGCHSIASSFAMRLNGRSMTSPRARPETRANPPGLVSIARMRAWGVGSGLALCLPAGRHKARPDPTHSAAMIASGRGPGSPVPAGAVPTAK